ncbi:MAG: diadenylate cyclase CdaA [Pyrinomonadaceae bacterium]
MIFILPHIHFLERIFEPRNLLDFALVYIIVYTVLRLLRGTRAVPMAAGISVFALLYWIAVSQHLVTLEFVLRGALIYLGVAIIVLFQTEIRRALMTLGNRLSFPFMSRPRGQFGEGLYDEIVLAATTLATTKTGALILIERTVGLRNIIDGGVSLDAALSYDLLVTIFNPTTPLHDGAVVVRGQRIAAASCFLPLTLNPFLSKDLGTRHRAAIGITEDSDAVAIVVSEETGLISFVQGGSIKRGLEATQLREMILDALQTTPRRIEKEIAPEVASKETETRQSAATQTSVSGLNSEI